MSCEFEIERAATACRPIVRHKGGHAAANTDTVIEEVPVALVFNGISHAVMMATPCDLEDFAIGFAVTEGIVSGASDVFEVEVVNNAEGAEVQLTIAQGAFMHLKDKRRSLAGRSGCGVCGIESIELLDLKPAPIARSGIAQAVTQAAIKHAAQTMPSLQTLMRETGGAHAAAWCSREGNVLDLFEDVGRHNALDKLIGSLLRRRENMSEGFVFMSSRASYELVRKAARVGIPLLATVSAPTSLAIRIAHEAGIRLLSFCRNDGFVEYVSG